MSMIEFIRRRPLVFALSLLGLSVIVGSGGGALLLSGATRIATATITHHGPPPGPADPTPADSGMAYTQVPLAARDGTRLSGWWIVPADGRRRPDLAVVVLAHAADERGKASLLTVAPALHDAGYIVFLVDFRSYGASEGTRTTHGFLEQQDVEAAVRLARERALGAPVALYGQGMGATACLLVAAQDPAIVCTIVDSPWESWDEAFFARAVAGGAGSAAAGSLDRFVPRSLIRWRLGQAIGFGFATPEAREPLVAAPLAASRPVMAIYGEKDEVIPFRHQVKLVSALGVPNATWAWRASGAGHLGAYASAPEEYRERLLEFLDASMVEWGKGL